MIAALRALIAVGTLATLGCATDDGPRLASVTPSSAAAGATVALAGSRLCGGDSCANAPATIALGIDPPMVTAAVVSYGDMAASFIVPPVAAGATAIIVTVGDDSSNALPFTVLP